MVASTQQQWPLQEPQQTQDTSPSLAKVNESRPNRDGTDALSSLLKRTIPLQEPYFLTRHAITSQHTLSTMGGVLFSLDEDPKEFNQDMYVAMRNRIFELEAKTVNYAPFNRSRKRPHHHLQTPPAQASRPIAMDGVHVNRSTHSCPSWCAPETYMYELHHDFPSRGRYSRAVNREWDQQRTSKIKHQEKQQLIQRYQLHFDYQKQRELCQPQHQHLQKTTGQFSPSWAVIESPLSSPQETTTSEPHVTRMISRSIAESPKGTNAALASTSSARFTLGDGPNLPTGASSVSNGEVLCSACIQYMQSYGKSRPVPPFRLNFMRKVHCRFKKELLQLRFQGWQDTQILEIDDRMTEREFRTLFFAGMEEGLAITSSAQSGEPSSPKLSSNSILEQNGASVATNIQDDDDDDDRTFDSLSTDELRTFTSEASLGDLFGHRWKMEPIVGYTLVHFGGSDRTRMVPMNPTVSSLSMRFFRYVHSEAGIGEIFIQSPCQRTLLVVIRWGPTCTAHARDG
ncbi:hypothetical protein BC939DRAFT_55058 [Gamsiella multidivaricata]|uniref:uncharacterized protein n=1 Tax=Gamsiella multidivaricata TaxID=101098 RepID=UPI00221F251B|nr:uncharacterized protein BC939DRAFT_55058 [Gamsiella multidivaricata]KAI7816245.1 hypothetical protein BC939DRAFT_55058 [Gamsiella multidivaricata]